MPAAPPPPAELQRIHAVSLHQDWASEVASEVASEAVSVGASEKMLLGWFALVL